MLGIFLLFCQELLNCGTVIMRGLFSPPKEYNMAKTYVVGMLGNYTKQSKHVSEPVNMRACVNALSKFFQSSGLKINFRLTVSVNEM